MKSTNLALAISLILMSAPAFASDCSGVNLSGKWMSEDGNTMYELATATTNANGDKEFSGKAYVSGGQKDVVVTLTKDCKVSSANADKNDSGSYQSFSNAYADGSRAIKGNLDGNTKNADGSEKTVVAFSKVVID